MPAVQKSADGWQFRRMPTHALKGVPDITLIKNGRCVGLEVKREKGRLSLDQVAFVQASIGSGRRQYYVVRSIDNVQALGL